MTSVNPNLPAPARQALRRARPSELFFRARRSLRYKNASSIKNSPQDFRMTIPFKTIRARAEKRKGGPKALQKLLPPKPDPKALAKLGDDRILAEMTKRVFSAGFAWSVIENKWPGFEKAFLGFKPGPLTLQPDEFWDT